MPSTNKQVNFNKEYRAFYKFIIMFLVIKFNVNLGAASRETPLRLSFEIRTFFFLSVAAAVAYESPVASP